MAEPAGLVALLVGDTVEESSHLRLMDGEVRPTFYRYHRHGGRRERLVELTFEWDQGRVINDVGGDRWVMEIPPGTLDKLVYQLAIMIDLERGERAMEYPIADGGTLKHYSLEVTGEEVVETPLGRVSALRVERAKESSKRTTRLWCAPRYHYLPVLVEQVKQDGETLRLMVESIQFGKH